MYIAPEELFIGEIASAGTESKIFDIGQGNHFAILVETLSANPDINITYECSRSYDGTYVTPSSNIILANCKAPVAKSFSPVLMQFIKVSIYNNAALPVTIGSYFIMQRGS